MQCVRDDAKCVRDDGKCVQGDAKCVRGDAKYARDVLCAGLQSLLKGAACGVRTYAKRYKGCARGRRVCEMLQQTCRAQDCNFSVCVYVSVGFESPPNKCEGFQATTLTTT